MAPPPAGSCRPGRVISASRLSQAAGEHPDPRFNPRAQAVLVQQLAWDPGITLMASGVRHLRRLSRCLAGAAVLGAMGAGAAQPQAITPERPNSFTLSPMTGLHEPVVEALLYNPPVDEFTWKPLDKPEATTQKLEPSLVLRGKGLPDGTYRLTYRIESGEKLLHADAGEVSAAYGGFELGLPRAASTRRPHGSPTPSRARTGRPFAARRRSASPGSGGR
jgi:hypothetical protein